MEGLFGLRMEGLFGARLLILVVLGSVINACHSVAELMSAPNCPGLQFACIFLERNAILNECYSPFD